MPTPIVVLFFTLNLAQIGFAPWKSASSMQQFHSRVQSLYNTMFGVHKNVPYYKIGDTVLKSNLSKGMIGN